jgi:hypothetical protein
MQNIEEQNPHGNIQLLVLRGAEYITQRLENQVGMAGIWNTLQPHVKNAIAKGLGDFELPTEAKILLSIMQANMGQKKIEEEKSL